MQLLTLHQAADLLQIHYQTAREWVRSGKLRASRPGRGWRIDLDDVRDLLRAGAYQPTPEVASPAPPAPPLRLVSSAPSNPLSPEWEIPTPRELRQKALAGGRR